MKTTTYDRIGINYNHNRKADARIVKWLDRLLNLLAKHRSLRYTAAHARIKMRPFSFLLAGCAKFTRFTH